MANLNGFNAHDIEPEGAFEPLPAGKYLAAITASEMKPTKSGNGSYLELTFAVLEGAYQGRTLWARLNLNNLNDIAVKIARGQLSAICRAVGVMQPRDSVDLHNLPLVINVKVKQRSDNEGLTNEVTAFEAKPSADPAAQAPAAAAATADATPPWKR